MEENNLILCLSNKTITLSLIIDEWLDFGEGRANVSTKTGQKCSLDLLPCCKLGSHARDSIEVTSFIQPNCLFVICTVWDEYNFIECSLDSNGNGK